MTKYYTKKEFWLSIFVTLIPTIYGVFSYNNLPSKIAIHFNVSGTPDNFVAKPFMIFGLPVLMALIQALTLFSTNFSSKNKPVPKKMAHLTVWIIPIITLVIYLATIQYALNNETDIRKIAVALIGLLFLLMGNYMPTIPSNTGNVLHFGNRYNLRPKDKYLQRYLGYIFVVSGILMLISLFFSPIVSTVITIISIVVIILYSIFVFFKIK